MKRVIGFCIVVLLFAGSSFAGYVEIPAGNGTTVLVGHQRSAANTNLSNLWAQGATKWEAGRAYVADVNMVAHGGNIFVCTSNHTASAAGATGTEPGVGDTWQTVWAYSGVALYEPLKGEDDNYVTDAEKVVIGNTSGVNTGDQDISGKLDRSGEPVLNMGAASTTTGLINLFNSGAAYSVGLFSPGASVPSVGFRIPGTMPIEDSVWVFGTNGYGSNVPLSTKQDALTDPIVSAGTQTITGDKTFSGTVTMTGTVNLPAAVTLPDDSVGAAQLADADLGGVTVSGGVVTVVGKQDSLSFTTTGLTAGKPYYRTAGGAWAEANGDSTALNKARCVAISTTQCITDGQFTSTSHGFTVGGDLFLSDTAGTMTSTLPSTADDMLQVLGWVLDANTLVIKVSPDHAIIGTP